MISFTQTFDIEITMDELVEYLDESDVLELCEAFDLAVVSRGSGDAVSSSVKELCDLAEIMLGAWTESESSDAHRLRMLLRDLRGGAL